MKSMGNMREKGEGKIKSQEKKENNLIKLK